MLHCMYFTNELYQFVNNNYIDKSSCLHNALSIAPKEQLYTKIMILIILKGYKSLLIFL